MSSEPRKPVNSMDAYALSVAFERGVIVTHYEFDPEDGKHFIDADIVDGSVASFVLESLVSFKNSHDKDRLQAIWEEFIHDSYTKDDDQFYVCWYEAYHKIPIPISLNPVESPLKNITTVYRKSD